jgi:two-component sensor histidine kinase
MEHERINGKDLRERLNKMYDSLEDLDKQIEMLILKRNKLKFDIETGVSILLVLDK